MAKILILTRDTDQRIEFRHDLAAESELEQVEIAIFGDYSSLATELVGDDEVLLVVINYELSYQIDDTSKEKVNETVALARKLSEKNGPPVLFIGPVDRSEDARVISRLQGVESIEARYMFDMDAGGKRRFYVSRILEMIDGPQAQQDEPETPTGLIELAIDDKDSVHCATTLIYRGGRSLNCVGSDFPYDSNKKKLLAYITQQLSEETNFEEFIEGYGIVGELTRDILNYDEATKAAISGLVDRVGGVRNVWIRFRVPYRKMSKIPFEAVLRCDHFKDSGPPEFQLKYSPVYRVVGDPSSPESELKFPMLSGLRENSPKRISCLIIDATTSGIVDRGNDSDLPANLPDIEENIRQEIEFVEETFEKVKQSGSISKIGKIDFSSDAEKNDPLAALDEIVKSNKWDIIHFSGHSIFKPGNKQISDRGYIFLPGKRAIPVMIMTVVEWFRKASLVYMSSCQSAEPAFVNALAEEGGIPTIIGFRWQVSSLGATQFAGLFYLNLFRDKTGDIESAFVEAQRCLVDPGKYPLPRELRKNKNWKKLDVKAGASPMLVMQDV